MLSRAVQDYQFAVLDLSPQTQRWYRQKLDAFTDWCGESGVELGALRDTDVRRFLHELRTIPSVRTGRTLTTYTVHGYAQVVKGFLSWCSKRDEYAVSARLVRQIDLPTVEQKIIQTFTRDQIKRLLHASTQEESRTLAERDQAILRVLLSTGIRAGELCGLTLDRTILTPYDAHIRVIGKGRKVREVGLSKEAARSLNRYVHHHRQARPGVDCTFVNRGGMPLTPDGLDQMLYRLRDWAGVTGVRVSAHTFRHTFAVEFLKQTGDIYRLRRLLGHSSVTVTEIYLKSYQDDDARKGVDVFGDI